MVAYFLAIDAGGTKTDYLLADDSRPLATARSGSIKRLRVSETTAEENLSGALQELSAKSEVTLRDVAVTCVGAAGVTVPLVSEWLKAAMARRIGGQLLLLEDVEIALDAAFFGKAGILVLAGTGSNVAGRSPDGTLFTAGGWGPALGDYGSGYGLGQTALRECFLAIDEGRTTTLLPEILSFWKLKTVNDLVEKANREPRPDVSELSAIVRKCAEQGDESALRVMQREAAALAHLVDVMIQRIRKHANEPDWQPEIAFTGSIMERFPAMRAAIEAEILRFAPKAQLHPGVIQPVEGALWRARRDHI